jgi:hypothetical protein
MKRMRMLGASLLWAIAVSAASVASPGAAEGGTGGLPEIGRCVKVSHHSGEYTSALCTHHRQPGHGKYQWLAGAGASQAKFSYVSGPLSLESTGKSAVLITCGGANGEGEYTSEKTLRMAKLVLIACQNPAVSGEKTWCQNSMSEHLGVIEGKELSGELGFIARSRKSVNVGVDLSGSIAFECEGWVELAKRSLGLGVARELTGSVIGEIGSVDSMVGKFAVPLEVVSGKQSPESLEGGSKDTLTTLVGSEKTPEPTVLRARTELKDEHSLEIKALCNGVGC